MGCKFGAAVFNSTFALAMQLMFEELRDFGITVKLRQGPSTFRDIASSADASGAMDVDSVDDAFVDDEAFFACASSRVRFDAAVDKMLEVISSVHSLLALEMSFKPKKTEAFLKYRGTRCTAARQARRTGPNGKLVLPILGSVPHVAVRVVHRYKHVGNVVSDAGNLVLDAKH